MVEPNDIPALLAAEYLARVVAIIEMQDLDLRLVVGSRISLYLQQSSNTMERGLGDLKEIRSTVQCEQQDPTE